MTDEDLIRRLRWAWESAPLLDAERSGETRLHSLRETPVDWREAAARFRKLHAARRTDRLGETFETLIRAAFEAHPAVARVVANLPVPDGEIDLLYSLRTRPVEFTAVELAVKFYVFDPAMPDAHRRWIGPARKDFLFRKVRRIFDLQVPRALAPAAVAALRERAPEARSIMDSVAWVRGELFARPGDLTEARRELASLPEAARELPLSPLLEASSATTENFTWLDDRWQWICDARDAHADSVAPTGAAEGRARMALIDPGTPAQRRAFVAPSGWFDGQCENSV